jgi:N6-adenosine-specific RNA methylase IME4
MSSSILYRNSDSTVLLIDIPRSIEIAQGVSPSRKIISSKPLEHPYPSVEPKSFKARAKLGEASLEDLLLQKHLQLALEEVKAGHEGKWCLSRVTGDSEILKARKKRKRREENTDGSVLFPEGNEECLGSLEQGPLHHNPHSTFITTTLSPSNSRIHFPPNSTALLGEISTALPLFTTSAPKFPIIVLDPPWPNRSARRKKSYNISYNTLSVTSLLSSLPLQNHLEDSGCIAIWITNKDIFRQMVLEKGGLFELWGVELVEEWIWLKVTGEGEVICQLDGVWRRPWEVVLVGQRRRGGGVKRRVLVGVPDLHSRKPNLKELFADEGLGLGLLGEEKAGLEIFARNLTSGWWGWGDEALKFQGGDAWVDGDGEVE